MTQYFAPILCLQDQCPQGVPLHGGALRFSHLRHFQREKPEQIIAVSELTPTQLTPFLVPPSVPRLDNIARINAQIVMGIVNVTPDSFSDGGRYDGSGQAVAHARALYEAGCGIVDIGGESTRPGAKTVDEDDEIVRVSPVLAALQGTVNVSLDTRKSRVAAVGIDAGVAMINDVSALTFDTNMARVVSNSDCALCLMHAQGAPADMQDNPSYSDVILDIYDALHERITHAESMGIARNRIVVDPGIGFGKTLEHNLAILKNIALFHGLGVPILVGVSRKRMIGAIGGGNATERLGGSVAVALHLAAEGVQIIRVHDGQETVQALKLWNAVKK